MKRIVFKYLNDTISEKELRLLIDWVQKPKNQKKFKEYVQLNNDLHAISFKVDENKAFEKILTAIKKDSKSRTKVYTNIFKYAAVFIGVLMLGYGIFKGDSSLTEQKSTPSILLVLEDGSVEKVNENSNKIIVNSKGEKVSEQRKSELIYEQKNLQKNSLVFNTLKVPYGKTFGLVLSDGTKVKLNSGSELKYPVNFIDDEKNRMVYLNGEAFFEVKKNTERPFIVNTKEMDIQVLGTKFNVTSYENDEKSYTVLLEGKVAAHNKLDKEEYKILQPNQRVFFKGSKLNTEKVNVDKYIAWINNKLVFIDDTFEVIKNKLERKYGITIKNNYEDLNKIMITATFENEKIEQVLKTFQTYQPFNYKIKNNVVTITKP